MSKSKKCKHCGKAGHTAFNCPNKPRKPLQARTTIKPKKRMRKVGKIGKALIAQADRFRKDHPGPQQCFYCEFIGIIELIDWYQVEHPYSKVHHPGLRFTYELLVPGCPAHNAEKSSKDVDVYLTELAARYGLPQARINEYLERLRHAHETDT